jgi:Anti-sigma factor NepR
MRACCNTRTTVSKLRPIGAQVPDFIEGSDGSRPKLGRHGRREIGRALEAMYDDVIKQGVPPRILQLLEGLDARAGGTRESPMA